MTSVDRRPDPVLPARQVALVDLLDRLLAGGVVITGDIVLSIADIDLVRISLRALISSVTTVGSVTTVDSVATVGPDARAAPSRPAPGGGAP
ncbi:gas vesicle protein [Streptomyces sp. NPDC089799]|uniref:gas vesicle protein n=1 Tax=Streptomyces sp. NPDC089799 TaxID=3155066 RepID=UPI003419E7F0